MQDLPSAAIVVTSIPYNIGVNYGEAYDDMRPMAEYLEWLRSRFEMVKARLQDDGSFFLNLDGDGWTPFQVAAVLKPLFCLQNRIDWIKSLVVPERPCPHCRKPIPSQQIGHFRSLGGDISLNRCGEFVLHLTKHRNVKLDRQTIGVGQSDKANTIRYGSSIHCAGNQWFSPYDTRTKEAEHPCPFPVELVKRCILLHGLRKPNLVVLDPFMGRGSAMRAVVEINAEYGLNVQGIGIDISPEYCHKAVAFIQGGSYLGGDGEES
jgi:site-specific DNA-methyltransferase (adenine-specific)